MNSWQSIRFCRIAFIFACVINSLILTAAASLDSDLRKAAEKGEVVKIQSLLAQGANVNATDGDGRNALFKAAEKDHAFAMSLLVDAGIDVNAVDKDGRTPLYWAAEKGRVGAIRVLVEAGTNVNAADKDGRTALYKALEKKHFRVVKMLVDAGADPQIADKNGRTPQSMMADAAKDANGDLRDAAKDGEVEKLHDALTKGADLETTKGERKTPLLIAAEKGHWEVIQILIEMGADLEAKDVDGSTAFMLAEKNEHANLAELLQRTDLLAALRRPADGANEFYGCETRAYRNEKDGGETEEKREFYALEMDTVKQFLIDSMMVVGFDLKKEEGDTFEGHRVYRYLGGGGAGGERFYASLENFQRKGVTGTLVTARTRKTRFMGRARQRVFTRSILDQVNCLSELLSVAQPGSDDEGSANDSGDLFVPDGTPVSVRLKHYLFSKGATEEDPIEFVASEDVIVDGVTVIRKGAPARGLVTLTEGPKFAARGAKFDFAVETIRGTNGQDIELRATRDPFGGGGCLACQMGWGALGSGAIGAGLMLFDSGEEVGIRAGTKFLVYAHKSDELSSGNSQDEVLRSGPQVEGDSKNP